MRKKYKYKAFITDKRGMVLSIGENNYTKTHPRMAKYSKYIDPNKTCIHAEVAAIIRCPDLSKAKYIKIYRVENDGSLTLNRPCRVCASAIKAAGLIVFGFDDI